MSENIAVQELEEKKRGCGYRKGGGMYFVGGGKLYGCDIFPIEVCSCKACGIGIKPSRGFSKIQPLKVFADELKGLNRFKGCHIFKNMEEEDVALLNWVGETYYPTIQSFLDEAGDMGISRRMPRLPMGFEPGKTPILLGHKKGRNTGERDERGREIWMPHIFAAFIPRAIQYVVKGNETPEELEAKAKRGFELVDVKPIR